MWSALSRVGQLFGLVSTEPSIDKDAIAAILDAADDLYEEDLAEHTLINNSEGVTCQHRVGTIVELFDNHGYIRSNGSESNSSQLYFKRQDGPSDIRVGSQVVYLAFRYEEDQDWIVRKILYVQNEHWDEETSKEGEEGNFDQPVVKEQCETAYKHVIAKVTGRRGRTVLAGDLHFCLDSVDIDFIPVEGDWVVLESLVQTERVADTILSVDRVRPLRSQTLDGNVSHWNTETQQGIVNSEVVFDKDSCEPGYLPKVGDEVRVFSIESEQGQLTWRAVHVVPTTPRIFNQTRDPKALTDLLRDKHGIVISEDTNCGGLMIGSETQITIEIKNESDSPHILQAVELTTADSQFEVIEPRVTNPRTVESQKSLRFIIKGKGRFVGRSTELIVFKFEGFEIGRLLAVDVQSPTLSASVLDSRARGTQHNKTEQLTAKKLLATRNGFIIPGIRPIKPASFIPVNLGMFVVPEKLINMVLGSEQSNRKEEVIRQLLKHYNSILDTTLSANNYVLRWDTLIHLEELEHSVNIARYNTQTSFRRVEDYLSMEILGLAERRPSLIVGDRVVAREAWTDENSWGSDCRNIGYEGYVHKVLSNEVLLKFNASFHDSCSGIYSVSFEANRTTFRREHQAIHVAFRNLGESWLLPSRISYQSPQIEITEKEDCEEDGEEDLFSNKSLANKSVGEIENSDAEKSEIINANNGNQSKNCIPEDYSCIPKNVLTCKARNSALESKMETDEDGQSYDDCKDNFTEEEFKEISKSSDGVLNTTLEEHNKSMEIKEASTRVKTDFPSAFENPFPKNEESYKLTSPPRVPVVARFLQNGNCPAEKSPNEVKNLLQQLANYSSTNNLPANSYTMKTVEEIEKSLFNCVDNDNNVTGDIEMLSEKVANRNLREFKTSPKNSTNAGTKEENSNHILPFEENKTTSLDNSWNKRSGDGKPEKNVSNNRNESQKVSKLNEKEINWNSNKELKTGNVKEVKRRIPKLKRRLLKWFNPLLNHRQKEAVRYVLKGEARPLPYVIFGPPGTGKTITLVEAILQIYSLMPESRLLIGTPSNSSADLVCERLLDSNLLAPGDLLRLVGFHYADQGRAPDWLRPYCGRADIKAREDFEEQPKSREGVVNMSRQAIGRHRITVGTCNTLGILYQMGFPRGHFTHVLIDEAGQATEPELLIPLAFLHSSYGQVVLAGDPLQLGPLVLSKVAEHFGLGESLLSRFLLRTPYQRDTTGYPTTGGYNPHLVTRLVYNYRSLPEILSLPNNMFYNGDLIPQVSEDSSEEAHVLSALKEVLPSRPDIKPPAVVFHGVRGTNCQTPDSPSWHNPHEAVQAAMYLQALYSNGLTPDQCGIITPYQAQVLKIRQMLDTLEIPLPKVGSVEEFQGQERLAIILSVVRSSPRLIESDLRYTVGFVASPRRLNVAITRARAVLIILGNPHLLALDQYWREVLSYCVLNRAYTGCDLPALNT